MLLTDATAGHAACHRRTITQQRKGECTRLGVLRERAESGK